MKKPTYLWIMKKLIVLKNNVEADFSKPQEEIDTLKKQVETDDVNKYKEIVVSRRPESRNSPEKHVEADISRKPESVVSRKPEIPYSPKKHEETDSSKKLEEIGMSKNPVEIGMEKNDISKKNVETNETKKLEDFDISKKQEIDVLKRQKETDILKPKEIDVCKKHEESNDLKKHDETDVLKKHDVSKKHEEIDTFKKSVDSELETLCARMGAKGMRRYVITHITDMNKLREELPKALMLAKDPAKLVLDSIGRFFLQTSKSFQSGRNHHEQVVSRLASVMILECFVMISSDGIDISKEDKAYAAEAAVKWKQRMVNEGGLRHMEEVDARGLLLLISGFGIRDRDFKIVDIRDLIMVSNVKGISAALRRSVILIPKVLDVIDMMVKNNMEIEAADTAYTFGLEDKCHPLSIVVIFLRKKVRDIQNGSPSQMLMAMKQQLSDLKFVKRCLEFHKVDPSYHLPDFKINEKIQYLEKEINNWNLTPKRKSTEAEFLENPMHHEAKRACYSHENMQTPVGHYPMNPYNRPAEPHNSYYDYGRGLAHSYGTRVYGGTVSDQMAHTANVQPYGWHGNPHYDNHAGQPYPTQSQTYDSQPYGRPPAESFPGYPARRARASDLYSFVDKL